ncbi:hypothetical protein DL766_005063 [Monosporascus sp. MC13-8B]|uniref:RING-type domain-containing protein n=1 Tax=Monosporascus cannonballus TaxID=155416 RepID=A0ABY0HBN6_9PEZI|nr:hypothetical protein DL763_010892 [Monosporascus cannonballus]RYO89375.1 hypothetical protein DL762_003266 [Monosporascus cannonballus]RYP30042.1 hypothetical protein DL766_005063 [Monosporascus sp. MC13-8B]
MPSRGQADPSIVVRNVTALSGQLAYSEHLTENLTTLSPSYGPTRNNIIQGLMYVPSLGSDDPCHEMASAYIPQNVTRQANLPMFNYNMVALAPWINAECALSYFTAVRRDSLRALLVYHPDGDALQPPDVDDSIWDLGDGGNWKGRYHFPVYAISSAAGHRMMQQLSLYSGDLSEVPFGSEITTTYHPDPSDYVRVWTELVISNGSGTFSVWVFVLIIIGLLLFVIGGISMLMHCIQRHRRAALRCRVESGEVNLEALGIKRLKVPTEHIQKFPLFTYNESPAPLSSLARSSAGAHGPRSTETGSDKYPLATDYQPDCQICLEEFESKRTVIRELPCGHIFHPECIDSFLSAVSSLCPICKASMLPPGYAPKITNGMVRRELATRRLRPPAMNRSDLGIGRRKLSSWSSSVKKHIGLGTSPPKHDDSIELPGVTIPKPVATISGQIGGLVNPVDERNIGEDQPPSESLLLKYPYRDAS